MTTMLASKLRVGGDGDVEVKKQTSELALLIFKPNLKCYNLVASAMGPLSLRLVISATWDFVVVAIGSWLLSPLWDLGCFYNVGPLLLLYIGLGCLRYGILIALAGCFNYVKPWWLPPLHCVS